jgi:hypothetical protein
VTAVIAINLLHEALVIADTRVSWKTHHRDCLKKLYGIVGARSRAVLGLAGDVLQAQAIISSLISEKFLNYNRRLVIPQLKDELCSWLNEIIPPPPRPEDRPSLRLLLAGLDPGRPQPKVRNGQLSGYMPFPTISFYEFLWGSETGTLQVQPRTGIVAPVGSISSSQRRQIETEVSRFLPFLFGRTQLYNDRARLITKFVSTILVTTKLIGGPFQVLRVAPDGIHQQFTWPSPPDTEYQLETQERGDTIVITNHTLNEQRRLYPIWDFPY